MRIIGLHHAQITVAPHEVGAARAFYCGVLGLPEIDKPPSLQRRGGFWVQLGVQQLHVGVESGVDRRRTKAHLAYEVADVEVWRRRLAEADREIIASIPIPGFDRFECRDPFGNRMEFISRSAE